MYVSSAMKKYDQIQSIEINDDVTSSKSSFYGDTYLLKEKEELKRFYQDKDITLPTEEYTNVLSLIEDEYIEYFFVQIPAGYKASKRNNVQGYIKQDEGQVMLTNNFYYYEPKKENLYCFIDIEKDDLVLEATTFSFYFAMPKELDEILSQGTIHLLYYDKEVLEAQSSYMAFRLSTK